MGKATDICPNGEIALDKLVDDVEFFRVGHFEPNQGEVLLGKINVQVWPRIWSDSCVVDPNGIYLKAANRAKLLGGNIVVISGGGYRSKNIRTENEEWGYAMIGNVYGPPPRMIQRAVNYFASFVLE